MTAIQQAGVLGTRALREAWRTPETLFSAVFIPLFFLIVNTGQVARIFPATSTDFLQGQSYAAFQLPATLLLAASFGGAAFMLVEEIEGGYFDKLRASPVSRSALVTGRMLSEGAVNMCLTTVLILAALPFGVRIASGPVGVVLLLLLTAGWAVVFGGFMQLIAMKTRSAAATQSASMIFFPLLFLTPNFVPREMLTRPMEIAATLNPVTYVMEAMRALVLHDLAWAPILRGFGLVAVLGVVVIALNVRMVRNYD